MKTVAILLVAFLAGCATTPSALPTEPPPIKYPAGTRYPEPR